MASKKNLNMPEFPVRTLIAQMIAVFGVANCFVVHLNTQSTWFPKLSKKLIGSYHNRIVWLECGFSNKADDVKIGNGI